MKKLYGLIGYPLIHSFSKEYFNNKFQAENLNAEYVNFQIPSIDEFQEVIGVNPNLFGLNVTIPYKEKVIAYLDEIDACAAEIGAVNVIKFIRHKDKLRLKGYNSDWKAFAQTLKYSLKPWHQKALILGAGGASKAVAYALQSLQIEYQFVSRTPEEGMLAYEDLEENVIEDHTIIVNTTPLGMYPNMDACPLIPYQYLTSNHLLYDLLYNPEKTLFMKKGEEQGAQVKNGLEMLLLQAFIGWQIWNE